MNSGGSWFKEFGCLGTIAAALVVVVYAVLVWPSIEDSKASRARALAAVEQAQASARAAEAQAQADIVEAEEEGDLAQLVERNAHELAMLREENREFQERLILLATVIEGMEPGKVDALRDQLDANEAHTSGWWIAVGWTCAVVGWLLIVLWAATRLRGHYD